MATKLSPVGAQFQVNQIVVNDQSSPEITPLSDGRFVVVYTSVFDPTGDVEVDGKFVAPDGTVLGVGTLHLSNVSGLQGAPAVAMRSGGGFTTVWQDFGTVNGSPIADPDIFYAVTDATGANTVSRTPILTSLFALQTPDIATMQDFRQIVVCERATTASEHTISFDVLNANGTTQLFAGGGFDFVDFVGGTIQRFPAVAGGPNHALVVWEDNNGEASSGDFHITARLFNGTTNTFATPSVVIADVGPGHSELDPDVAYIGGGRYVIVYAQDLQNIFAKIFNPGSGALSPQIAINTTTAPLESNPKVAATADGGFVVTWSESGGPAPDTNGLSVHARRFDPYGNPFGDDFVVNTLADSNQSGPVVGVAGGNVMGVWSDSAVRPGDANPDSIQAQAATAPGFDYDSAAYGDFDNTGRSDLLFQNASTGEITIWTTNSAGVASSIVSGGLLPSGFKIDGTGNFNSTPGDDILLRNAASGQVAVFVTNGTSVVDFKVLGSTSPQFLNSGNGDFTGDGQSDLLFRNTGTGEIASWKIVDNALAAPPQVLGSAPSIFQIVAVADFTGDHQADILFRNLGTGEIAEWQLANNQLVSAPQVVGSTSTAFHVVGTGDFDGNGANDILFRHDNGELAVWLLNSAGQLLTSPQSIATVANKFHVDGTGDLNGDGRSDIIFRDPDGNVIEWLMNGASAQAIQTVGSPSQDFAIAAHHFDLI